MNKVFLLLLLVNPLNAFHLVLHNSSKLNVNAVLLAFVSKKMFAGQENGSSVIHFKPGQTKTWEMPERPTKVIPYLYIGTRPESEQLFLLRVLAKHTVGPHPHFPDHCNGIDLGKMRTVKAQAPTSDTGISTYMCESFDALD